VYGLIDLLGDSENTSAYVASEYIFTDGPFESSQNFNRLNVMGKLVKTLQDDSKISLDFSMNSHLGIGLRHDNIEDNELSSTLNRRTLRERFALGDVHETNMFTYASTELDFGNWLIVPGVRLDFFSFEYVDFLQTEYNTQSKNATVVSPKLNFIYNPNPNLQLYLKTGKGFHANDTRVSVNDELPTLPAAYGADLGSVWKPNDKVWISTALWYLYLEQEFVYVGDAAIVEPSGETRRTGVELGTRIQLTDNLFFDTDGTYTIARSIEEGVAEGEDFIPLAPDLTIAGGLSYNTNRFNTGLRYQYVKDRPANEDNSIVAEGYTVVEANINYKFDRITIGIDIDNLFNTEWNQAQFATESRLQGEPQSVEEIHFTPGTPFNIIGRVAFRF